MTNGRAASAGCSTSVCAAPRTPSRPEGRVWLIDPVDADGVEERVRALGRPGGVLQLLDRHNRDCAAWAARLGVPHIEAWRGIDGAPFEALPVRDRRWWHEVALWEPSGRTLRLCGRSRDAPVLPCAVRADRVAPVRASLPAPVDVAGSSAADPRRPWRGRARRRDRGASRRCAPRTPAASGGLRQCAQNQLVGGQ